MIRNYFKIAVRNLKKYKFISFINIFGLATGLTCCLLILAYFLGELNYDKYHKNAESIYRVTLQWKWQGGNIEAASTSGPITPLLLKNFPEVQYAARIFSEGTEFVKTGEQSLEITPVFTENSFFKIFTYHFLYGNPSNVLTEPNSIVLTETTARKIFGDASLAPGKIIQVINRAPQKITGVISDVPAQSHFHFDAVGVLDTKADFVNGLQNFGLYTYVLLAKGTHVAQLESKISRIMANEINDHSVDFKLPLQPLTDIHLHSHLTNEMEANGNIMYVYVFAVVAAIILLLACINYSNLATAQTMRRAKEVGIRKVLGSARWQLVAQFFTESLLLVVLASVLSLIAIELLTPLIKHLIGKDISLWNYGWPFVAGLMAVIAVTISILSGIYPAIFLSDFKPGLVLKGVFSKSPSNVVFRKSLVVFQFTISIALIAFTWITYRQLNFVTKEDLGFSKDQIVGVRIPGHELRRKNLTAFKTQLARNPSILASAATTNPLGNDNIGARGFFLETNGQKPSYTTIANQLGIDADYLQMMQIPLKEGRNLSGAIASDSEHAVIVNETLAKKAGWKQPLGKRIWYFIDDDGNTKEAIVVGVVKDFHIASLHKPIEPLLLTLASAQESDNLYIKIKAGSTPETLGFIQKTYRQFDNYNPFETYFLDENFAKQYEEDTRKGNLFLVFTTLAIFIACLGLFGLAAFTAEQRTKEIGIRKVLGASLQSLLFLLSKDFLQLVVVAVFIATPLAWWAMNKWLQEFAYRVTISWWIFVAAGMSALVIAFATVSFQAIKTVRTNPADSLKAD